MIPKLKKFVSGTLCVTMLTAFPCYAATGDDDYSDYGSYDSKDDRDYDSPNDRGNTLTVSTVKRGNAFIPRGTVLEIEISRTFSSKNFKEGDAVPLRLAENLIVNDVVVAPRFSRVKGIVTRARKAGGFGRSGRLEFKIISFRTLNGIEIPLEFSLEEKGRADKGAVPVAVFVSLVGGAFMKGQNVTIQQGTRFEAEVPSDTDLEVSLDDLKHVMESNAKQGVKVTINR